MKTIIKKGKLTSIIKIILRVPSTIRIALTSAWLGCQLKKGPAQCMHNASY